MQCRPSIPSLYGNFRVYTITINNDLNFKGVLLKDAPFNAQIGVIAHELAHIIDYENKDIIGIIGRGLDYLSDKDKAKYEQTIDMITIRQGLGWQLYDWSDFVLNKSTASTDYKEFKRKIYMTPEQIEKQIRILDIYKDCR